MNLSETDTITASMLEDVRKLRIVGKEILEDEDTFWGEGHHVNGKDSSFGSVRGDIKDLSDLAQMTNLEELALCNQEIEDISGLKELPLKKALSEQKYDHRFLCTSKPDRSGYSLYYGESGRGPVTGWRMHQYFPVKYTGDESE